MKLRDIEDKSKRFNMHLNRVPEGENRDNTDKAIFKERMVETFPELMKDTNPQTHEAYLIPSRINFKNLPLGKMR